MPPKGEYGEPCNTHSRRVELGTRLACGTGRRIRSCTRADGLDKIAMNSDAEEQGLSGMTLPGLNEGTTFSFHGSGRTLGYGAQIDGMERGGDWVLERWVVRCRTRKKNWKLEVNRKIRDGKR